MRLQEGYSQPLRHSFNRTSSKVLGLDPCATGYFKMMPEPEKRPETHQPNGGAFPEPGREAAALALDAAFLPMARTRLLLLVGAVRLGLRVADFGVSLGFKEVRGPARVQGWPILVGSLCGALGPRRTEGLAGCC